MDQGARAYASCLALVSLRKDWFLKRQPRNLSPPPELLWLWSWTSNLYGFNLTVVTEGPPALWEAWVRVWFDPPRTEYPLAMSP